MFDTVFNFLLFQFKQKPRVKLVHWIWPLLLVKMKS